ncbi:MAG: ArsR/SmtB family transcription factor [Solirubrobacteraceae bacterium]
MPNSPSVRQVTDSRVLAAMAHPLRRRLMDVLKVHGPSTATALARRTDQAVANVSHHLRVLAAAELVEQAPELARDRRERWWRLVSANLQWSTTDFQEDAASAAVAEAAQRLTLEHHVEIARQWFAASESEREAWNEGAFTTSHWLRLAPAELGELGDQMNELLDRWVSRAAPDDGQRREPVFVFAIGVPGQP